ncbi:3-oxoacyl-[acyl-carrier-protein] synthase III C-terminal domain-containing protein [uncultured Brachyspira sp.]|uniref:3-oxoacyl-ACP synthase III family protein n=1 Tax=uncultured Brachyspira sp. TaxID=221953 RepID=UPI0025D89F8A|nr:3-oxoacyl-[acyl-carrier-protein] synthase III C-terminal domain-containing protein [uncultured Brachyspira sp.]
MVYIKSCKSVYKNKKTNMAASDLALIPINEVIKDISPNDIDAIICATVTKDYVYPSTACILSGKIKASNAFSFDIESDFTGFLSALRLAYAFIESNRYKNILVVATESFYICDDENRFDDASVAALITNEKSDIQIDFVDSVTDGSALENCYIPMGGTAKPYTKEGVLNKEHFISIKNSSIFEEEAKKAGLYVKDILSSNNINPNFYIPSYSTKDSYNAFVNALSVNEDIVYSKMVNANSSLSASSGVALSMALEDGFIKKNSKVAICGYGSGYTKSVAVVSIN